MPRILLLLSATDWQAASAALQSAKAGAAHPEQLTYGLSLMTPPTDADQAEMHALGAVMYLAPGADSWHDMEKLWQGEPYVLIGTPDMRFDRRWDGVLMQTLRWSCKNADNDRCLLTGFLPREADPVDAVCPVAADRIDRRGRLCFTRGTPLRYAVHPQVSAFLHTGFCFAPSVFFRTMKDTEYPLFLEAWLAGWDAYTLHKPVIRLQSDMDDDLPPVNVSCCGEIEGVGRFETRFGVRFSEKKLGSMARCGIFNPDLSFDRHVPLLVKLQETMRGVTSRDSRIQPLCVTAWLTTKAQPLDETHMQHFRRLAGMKNLPLLCFVDRESAARVERSHPDIREFQARHGLDVPMEAILSDERTYVRLSKLFMLAQCREHDLAYSHYIWLNFDAMQYPVYEGVALDWSTICDGLINVAMVEDQLDLSMIAVPEELVEPLCVQISSICNRQWRRGEPLPSEQAVWNELYDMHVEWFHIHPMPGWHELLTLTMPLRGEEFNTQ